ncbi:hypothetical protein PVAP13_8NG292652 [Panicum virgatum]|uniref:Uncharacterized protein n=1 Tax=Panicum virgatum TaxID=38727 RepID=A0A8T0PF56_PANVG|nr:hypothetical protein PVAP13_8NG292652 [Panicum virgatum]
MKGNHQAQWHKLKRKPVENELSHPADDDECDGFQVQLNEGILENEHPVGEECVCVNASVVDTLRTQRVEEELENEASDSEDETGWQYLSDDEGPAIPHDDEDDDSDLD